MVRRDILSASAALLLSRGRLGGSDHTEQGVGDTSLLGENCPSVALHLSHHSYQTQSDLVPLPRTFEEGIPHVRPGCHLFTSTQTMSQLGWHSKEYHWGGGRSPIPLQLPLSGWRVKLCASKASATFPAAVSVHRLKDKWGTASQREGCGTVSGLREWILARNGVVTFSAQGKTGISGIGKIMHPVIGCGGVM